MDGMLSQDEINALLSGMDLSKGADGDTTADPAKTGDAGEAENAAAGAAAQLFLLIRAALPL